MYSYYIPTPRPDRDEDGNIELPVEEKHDCLDHLDSKEAEWTEEHGERCRQEWWECSVCHERFSDSEVERMMAPACPPTVAIPPQSAHELGRTNRKEDSEVA